MLIYQMWRSESSDKSNWWQFSEEIKTSAGVRGFDGRAILENVESVGVSDWFLLDKTVNKLWTAEFATKLKVFGLIITPVPSGVFLARSDELNRALVGIRFDFRQFCYIVELLMNVWRISAT